jgi:hypothetical protein
MLKKTITFPDLDGNMLTEDFYFNLNKAEVVEIGFTDMQKQLTELLETENMSEILKVIRGMLATAVGRRSEDGRRFIKSQEISDDFTQSEAFSELFFEMMKYDEKQVNEFFLGMLPASLVDDVKAQQVENTRDIGEVTILPVDPPKLYKDTDLDKVYSIDEKTGEKTEYKDPKPWITENREPTRLELQAMSKAEIVEAYNQKHTRD